MTQPAPRRRPHGSSVGANRGLALHRRPQANERTPAALYIRVSSVEQEDKYSLAAQMRLLRDYAARNKLEIAVEFVEVETAKRVGRTAFGELLEFVRRRPETVILVEKTDRLYRNFRDWLTVEELGAEVHFVKDGDIVSPSSNSSGRLTHAIKVAMAKHYIDNLSEETKKGQEQKAREGWLPTLAPYGYRNVEGPGEARLIEPDPAARHHVLAMYERYATGSYSIDDIAQMAEADGMRFRPRRRRKSRKTSAARRSVTRQQDPEATGAKEVTRLPRSSIHRILENPFYKGVIVWKDKSYTGKHVPIVDVALWDRVQSVLTARTRAPNGSLGRTFMFAGLVRCTRCGCAITAELKKGKYIYYHCTGYLGRCRKEYVREEVLEQAFADVLGRLAINDEARGWVKESLRDGRQRQKQVHEEVLATLTRDQATLEARIEKAWEDKLDGAIELDIYERKTSEWREELGRIEAAIARHKAANQTFLDEGVMLLEICSGAKGFFEQGDAAQKRLLLEIALSNSSWGEGRLSVTFNQPFDMIAEAVAHAGAQKAAGSDPDGLRLVWGE